MGCICEIWILPPGRLNASHEIVSALLFLISATVYPTKMTTPSLAK